LEQVIKLLESSYGVISLITRQRRRWVQSIPPTILNLLESWQGGFT